MHRNEFGSLRTKRLAVVILDDGNDGDLYICFVCLIHFCYFNNTVEI